MLTKSLIKKAVKLSKNWTPENDRGVFIDRFHHYYLKRVPEWAKNWTELDLTE